MQLDGDHATLLIERYVRDVPSVILYRGPDPRVEKLLDERNNLPREVAVSLQRLRGQVWVEGSGLRLGSDSTSLSFSLMTVSVLLRTPSERMGWPEE